VYFRLEYAYLSNVFSITFLAVNVIHLLGTKIYFCKVIKKTFHEAKLLFLLGEERVKRLLTEWKTGVRFLAEFFFRCRFCGPIRPTQRIKGAVYTGILRPDRETDHAPPSGVEIKNE
jgi:hypothetical protein